MFPSRACAQGPGVAVTDRALVREISKQLGVEESRLSSAGSGSDHFKGQDFHGALR